MAALSAPIETSWRFFLNSWPYYFSCMRQTRFLPCRPGAYARIVTDLRRDAILAGSSKPDLWIAAWALEHGAPLATRNTKHFERISELVLISY